MKYTYKMKASQEAVYQALMREQLHYFQQFIPGLKKLRPRVEISKTLQTKQSKKPVQTTIKVSEIRQPDLYVQEADSANGYIVQTFNVVKTGDTSELVYSEDMYTTKGGAKRGYGLFTPLYKHSFNSACKKRGAYLDKVALDRFTADEKSNTDKNIKTKI
ncbi:DUF3284 domain-containing protein [Companilactobacillus hulinensis]|uniref:DUF3284 domain-containing protein n=1 Tax=Companilactobacillus hulinensis TaxID=2486007 RepID=UPI000F768AD8|nr:DUF3284 domain-containing protein [Companilactobacillus hulinensis]